VVHITAKLWLSAHKTATLEHSYFTRCVATRLRCGEIFGNNSIANCLQSGPVEKGVKIGPHFAKIWTKVLWHIFTVHGVLSSENDIFGAIIIRQQ